MHTYTLSQLTEETLNALVTLHEEDGAPEEWENMQIALTSEECMLVDYLKSTLHRQHLMVLNEITLWSRAIYPLLRLAEQRRVRAWAGVPLKAKYPTFELEGEADGALAPSAGGRIRPPYLVVHEAKRGVNAPKSKVRNGVAFGMREAQLHFGRLSHKPLRLVDITFPQFQLYGEMLAAAWLNGENNFEAEQKIFGCYTVNESWAFVRGVVSDMETEKPTFNIEFAPVYNGISDAERIVQLLKFIVAKKLESTTLGGFQ